ncbi:MAG: UDP-N-acetylmuramoyl-L-alanyl-D-glutamate--2,6-diaminopimelate ligase [Thermomicrobiales bacterium]|nr:UDP-N-acetylmuramoyl-L-alanyl-D-glutamate--2,6-diaminopimelate ligase [Thermomicrobiales bacterium]
MTRPHQGRDDISTRYARAITEIVADVPNAIIHGDTETVIQSVEFDSRLVESGGLFVALRGGYTDGHVYLDQARKRGAVAALVERGEADKIRSEWPTIIEVDDTRAALAIVAAEFYYHPSQDLCIVGVTGTDGKTTTSHLIEAMLRHVGRRTGLIGTVEVRIAGEVDLHESRQTTPESLVIQRILATMRDRSVDTAILEATSHGLVMHRLDSCAFDIGVVTNITHEHLDFHGSVEAYREAKAMLLDNVARDKARGRRGALVLNRDDEGARSVAAHGRGCDILWYSMDPESDAEFRASAIEFQTAGQRFTLHTPMGDACISLALPGRYNVANALAAAAVGHALSLSLSQIAEGLESLDAVPGRMQSVDEGQPYSVIVDYAHTPDAIKSVLTVLRDVTPGRLMVLFGSAGERDIDKRAIQGQVAIEYSDFAVFASEDPRFEDPMVIIDAIADGAMQAGGRRGVDFDCIEDRRTAIATILQNARAGDVVVLAGKGHEKSMIYGSEKRPWDEAAVAAEVLRKLGYSASNQNVSSQ